ncbi:3-phosphoshikimate 1-carboxyvinyltransferase [Candidatus Omnitrophota bacterium]
MPSVRIQPLNSIRREIFLPGDKSIAHRSIFISAIAKGKTGISNFPASNDCLKTLAAFRKLGVKISVNNSGASLKLGVEGRGLKGLRQPNISIFSGESGTTFRLLLGFLAGQRFRSVLTAGKTLRRRPMRRVCVPLRKMGAVIKAQQAGEEYPPVTINGRNLRAINYKMPVASAQVKSALLFAGLYAKGVTRIREPIKTRDHTERMLEYFGTKIKVKNKVISLSGGNELISPGRIDIPGDISSASFFIAAAILLRGSRLVIRSLGLNPGRRGIIRVLKRMGAEIKIVPRKFFACGSEPVGDIIVKTSRLKGTKISRQEVPQLIDELPILMLVACYAKGATVIEGAGELRFKETDRIASMESNLKKMGADIRISIPDARTGKTREKIIIQGVGRLRGARVRSFADHRTAMSMVVAAAVSHGPTFIDDLTCIDKSFPDFLKFFDNKIR